MADELTLGLAERSAEDPSKAELQRRMHETRDSISQTVTEIKDTVVHQYETVKETINDTLDWREQFKKRPVACSLGAVGGGFAVGYALAAVVKGDSSRGRGPYDYVASHYSASPGIGEVAHTSFDLRDPTGQSSKHQEAEVSAPGMFERLQQTEAYDRLRQEAVTVGSRFVDELSLTAHEVVLPAAVSWIRQWLTGLLPETNTTRKPDLQAQVTNQASRPNSRT